MITARIARQCRPARRGLGAPEAEWIRICLKTKSIEQLVGDAEHGGKALKRTLTAFDLTLLGIGAIIGTGIFVLTGTPPRIRPARPSCSRYVAGRARLRLRRALLRGVRRDDSDLRQRLHLRLRDARRDLRLDDRLGPDPRVRRRIDDGRDRLERLLPAASSPGFGVDLPVWMSAAPGHRGRRARSSTCRPCSSSCVITALLVIGVRESARFNAVMVVDQARRGPVLHRRRRRLRRAGELVALHAVRLARRHGAAPRSSSSPTSASTPSRRRPKRRRTRSATCRSASSRRSSSAPILYLAVAAILDAASSRVVQYKNRRAVPERAGRRTRWR